MIKNIGLGVSTLTTTTVDGATTYTVRIGALGFLTRMRLALGFLVGDQVELSWQLIEPPKDLA